MKNLNLTPRAQKLLQESHKLACEMKHDFINHLHIFIGFFLLKSNQIQDAFETFEVNTKEVESEATIILNKTFQKENPTYDASKFSKSILSSESKELFKFAKQLSLKYDHKYIGLEHIFLCLFEKPDFYFQSFLETQNIKFGEILQFIENKLSEDDLITSDPFADEIKSHNNYSNNRFDPKKYKILNTYATNLNEQVAIGKINVLHINKNLIQKISEILCRKNKSNPLIIGEAGVGKTALVESLAQSIVRGDCSDFLLVKNVYNLDISMIVAGCKHRGEFEEKMKNLMKEIANDPYIIIFIDEIHTIVGAGNPENGMDIANILKPYLARGEITCIGATTYDEYKRKIASDPALCRRFQTIKLEEPNKEQAFQLIKSIKHDYEGFHFIGFSDEIIKFIIDAADKYLEGRFPDKALDIIDQVGAKMKLKNFAKTSEMLKLEQKMKKLVIKQDKKESKDFQASMDSLLRKYQEATEKMVIRLKTRKFNVSKEDVLEVISDKTNIPVSDLKLQDYERVKTLKDILNKEVVGQKDQIDQIYKCILRAKVGFRNFNKPTASFLFAGPTGVGKTLTAKILAGNLFFNKNNFIFIDLSEYTDKTSVNKLIGSNPGYIGYEKGGVLTEKVKRNPYSLILFDEIQKAHEDVLYMLLQILEEGKISDSLGNIIDFSNSIIVLTTNIGSETVLNDRIGFNSETKNVKSDVISSVKKFFPPDFLNRIDEIIAFQSLSESQIKEIIEKELSLLKENIKNNGIDLTYSPTLIDFIFSKIQFGSFGARQVSKTIQREIETVIAEKMLEKNDLNKLKISVEKGVICVI